MSFYEALHNLSTADVYEQGSSRKRKVSSGTKELFEIERVISRKVVRGKREYYVKWQGYSSLENSWEPEEHLNAAALRAFENPVPSTEAIEQGKDALACGLLEQLKSRSTLPTVIPFRHDLFRFFFGGKGEKSNERGAILLSKADFQACNFPKDWDRIVDNLGDGLRIDFPVKVRPFLSWSPKTHGLEQGRIVQYPRYRPEKLSISLCKTAFSLS